MSCDARARFGGGESDVSSDPRFFGDGESGSWVSSPASAAAEASSAGAGSPSCVSSAAPGAA